MGINGEAPIDAPIEAPKKARAGKPKLPEERRRVFLSVRVLPKTKRGLVGLEARNLGHALDKLVALAEAAGVITIPPPVV